MDSKLMKSMWWIVLVLIFCTVVNAESISVHVECGYTPAGADEQAERSTAAMIECHVIDQQNNVTVMGNVTELI